MAEIWSRIDKMRTTVCLAVTAPLVLFAEFCAAWNVRVFFHDRSTYGRRGRTTAEQWAIARARG